MKSIVMDGKHVVLNKSPTMMCLAKEKEKTHTHTHTHTHTRTRIYTQALARTNTHTRARNTHTHARTHPRAHSFNERERGESQRYFPLDPCGAWRLKTVYININLEGKLYNRFGNANREV